MKRPPVPPANRAEDLRRVERAISVMRDTLDGGGGAEFSEPLRDTLSLLASGDPSKLSDAELRTAANRLDRIANRPGLSGERDPRSTIEATLAAVARDVARIPDAERSELGTHLLASCACRPLPPRARER